MPSHSSGRHTQGHGDQVFATKKHRSSRACQTNPGLRSKRTTRQRPRRKPDGEFRACGKKLLHGSRSQTGNCCCSSTTAAVVGGFGVPSHARPPAERPAPLAETIWPCQHWPSCGARRDGRNVRESKRAGGTPSYSRGAAGAGYPTKSSKTDACLYGGKFGFESRCCGYSNGDGCTRFPFLSGPSRWVDSCSLPLKVSSKRILSRIRMCTDDLPPRNSPANLGRFKPGLCCLPIRRCHRTPKITEIPVRSGRPTHGHDTSPHIVRECPFFLQEA